MANRQIYELDDAGFPNLNNVMVTQASDGATEAQKSSLLTTKIAMNGLCQTYSAGVTFSAGPTFVETQLENDFTGVTYTYDNPSNGTIRITASEAIFNDGLTFCVSGAVNDAGTPYFLTGSRFSDTVCNFKILLHDGTGASTPFFADVVFTIKVKRD